MTEVDRLRTALKRIRHAAVLKETGFVRSAIIAIADEALALPQPTLDTRPVLTARQAEVLSYIRESIASRGCAPTVREIGRHFDVENNAIQGHLKALESKGYLRHEPRASRTLSLVEAS